jgi:mannosyltransferase
MATATGKADLGARPRRHAISRGGHPGSRLSYSLAAVAAAAAITGAIRLGAKSLWHDEAYSAAMARLPWSSFVKAILRQESFSALYYLFLRPWTALGTTEAWLRAPSLTFGILAACVLFALNRRLFGVRVATVGTVLLVVNPFFIRYEQEARAYSLAMLAAIVATYVFVLAVETPSAKRWTLYGVAGAVAVYAHPFAAFVLAAHLLSLAFRRVPATLVAIGFGTAAVIVAPLFALLFAARNIERGIARPGFSALESALLELTGTGVRSRSSAAMLLAYACFAGVGVAAGVVAARRHAERGRDRSTWSTVLALAWLGVPILGSMALSFVRPIFLPRYLVVALPGLVTVAALGIAAAPWAVVRGAALTAIVALSIPWLIAYYRGDFKNGEDWRRAVEAVVAHERAGDGIVFLSRYGRRPFEYYLDRFHGTVDLTPVYPSYPWGRYTPVLADQHFPSARRAAAELDEAHRRIWAVLLWGGFDSPHEAGGSMERALDRQYTVVWRGSYGRFIHVILYERANAAVPTATAGAG